MRFVLHPRALRKWVEGGKGVDVEDNNGKTPLHYAAEWGRHEVLGYLIQCGASVDAKDNVDDTPLHMVSTHLAPFFMHRRLGSPTGACCVCFDSGLQACYWAHPHCVELLLQGGADPNARDLYGNLVCDLFDDHVSEKAMDEVRRMVRNAAGSVLARGGGDIHELNLGDGSQSPQGLPGVSEGAGSEPPSSRSISKDPPVKQEKSVSDDMGDMAATLDLQRSTQSKVGAM